MGSKIAIVGTGAVGGYAGAHMAQAGEDVTFIDPWPAHVDHMKKHGLRVTHAKEVAEFKVPVRALHLTEVQQLAKEKPVDIAFVCMKSYDTAWATMMIRQYLAPDGFVVSLQNCMNEETIAGVVGWGKTLGCIASSILVNLPEPGHIHRGAGKGGKAHTVFRTGEVHGRITDRGEGGVPSGRHRRQRAGHPQPVGRALVEARRQRHGQRAVRLHRAFGLRDAAERADPPLLDPARSEAIRVGQALGYQLEEILHLPPETIAKAGEGDLEAEKACDAQRIKDRGKVSSEQRPSMGQDMQKGRRTEIEFLNGYVVREGEKVGIKARANAVLTDIVKRVEKGELKPDPRHIEELRLN